MPASRTASTSNKPHTGEKTRQTLPKGAACIPCRSRKVRCSGESPVCSTCVKHAGHEGKEVTECWSAGLKKSSSKASPRRTKRAVSASSDSSSSSAASGSSSQLHDFVHHFAPLPTLPLSPSYPDPLDIYKQSAPDAFWSYTGSPFSETFPSSSNYSTSSFDFSSPMDIYSPPSPTLSSSSSTDSSLELLCYEPFEDLFSTFTTVDTLLPTAPAKASSITGCNFDHEMSSLAALAAHFSLSTGVSNTFQSAPTPHGMDGVKTSTEELDNIWLNEPCFSML
ncbi:hypothetical protein P7C70_g2646, partial [Phenoliferia sp. Uapishka_3]